jgi:uncharacterized protein (TIRG00374 family)
VNKRWLRFLFGVLLGAGALWLAARTVDWAGTWQALKAADFALLLAALGVQCASLLLVAGRWRALFPAPVSIPLGRLVEVLLVAQLVNAVFPFRPGPLARAYLVGERDGEGVAPVLATVAGEKLLEMLALALGVVLLLFLLPIPGWLRRVGIGVVLLAALGLGVVLMAAGGRRWIERWVTRLGRRVAGVSLSMLDTTLAWLRASRAGQLALWTAGLWAAGAGINLLVLAALGIPARFSTAVTLLILLQLGVRVPGAPANAGVFESLCVFGLGWFGVEPTLALSYGFALHAVVLLPGVIGGTWVLWRDSAARAELRRATRASSSGTAGESMHGRP